MSEYIGDWNKIKASKNQQLTLIQELRKNKAWYLVILGVIIVAVLGTHFADSAYYNNKIDSQATQASNLEQSYSKDFNNLADITIFQYKNINPNCNMFKNGDDKSQCQGYEQSKQALQ